MQEAEDSESYWRFTLSTIVVPDRKDSFNSVELHVKSIQRAKQGPFGRVGCSFQFLVFYVKKDYTIYKCLATFDF